MASSGAGPLSMSPHFATLGSSQGQVDCWVGSNVSSNVSDSGGRSWVEESDFAFSMSDRSDSDKAQEHVFRGEGRDGVNNMTLFKEQEIVIPGDWPLEGGVNGSSLSAAQATQSRTAQSQRSLRLKSGSKTSTLRGVPASPSSRSPRPKGLLRSFSEVSSLLSLEQALSGTTPVAAVTADDTNKPPLPVRRRPLNGRAGKPLTLLTDLPPLPDRPCTPKFSRHRVTPSAEFLPPITPRGGADSVLVNSPLTSSSVGGQPWCPSPELPDDCLSVATPTFSRTDTGSTVCESPAVPLSPGNCPRSRSMSGAPPGLAPALVTAGGVGGGIIGDGGGGGRGPPHLLVQSMSLNQRQHSELGTFWWQASQATSGSLTPRGGGGSCRLSPRQPAPPLRLGPLARALAEGDVEAIREAAFSVRMSLKGSKDNKGRLIQAGGIHSLVQLARSEDAMTVDHGVTALFNVCRVEGAAEEILSSGGIEALVGALKAQNTPARENAAAAIFCLADEPAHRNRICEAGAIPLLVELLRSGSLRGQKDAALALFNLLRESSRGGELVEAGGVKVLLSLLQGSEAGLEDKAMAVLAFVAKSSEGREAIVRENGLLAIIDVLELASQRAREDAVAALFHICNRDVEALGVISKEGVIPALHKICQSPSERAKAKARSLLQLLRSHRC